MPISIVQHAEPILQNELAVQKTRTNGEKWTHECQMYNIISKTQNNLGLWTAIITFKAILDMPMLSIKFISNFSWN